jgi:hypothetical protein
MGNTLTLRQSTEAQKAAIGGSENAREFPGQFDLVILICVLFSWLTQRSGMLDDWGEDMRAGNRVFLQRE